MVVCNTFINRDLPVEKIDNNGEVRSYKKAAAEFKIDCKITRGKLAIVNKIFTVEELRDNPLELFGLQLRA